MKTIVAVFALMLAAAPLHAQYAHKHKQPTVVSVNIRPQNGPRIAGDSVQLCAFLRMSDGTIRIGTPATSDSTRVRIYCSGAPLTAYLSERRT